MISEVIALDMIPESSKPELPDSTFDTSTSRTPPTTVTDAAVHLPKKRKHVNDLSAGTTNTSSEQWSKATCGREALKYRSVAEFEIKSQGAHQAAVLNGWLREVCGHMQPLNKTIPMPCGYWNNKDRCHREALKYKSRFEFNKGNESAYNASRRNKWLDEVCSHMPQLVQPTGHWNKKDNCRLEALKYKSRNEFSKRSEGAYNAARRNKWIDEVCSHMQKIVQPSGHWNNKENCRLEALKYRKRSEFKTQSVSAYNASKKNGWIEEMCAHMS